MNSYRLGLVLIIASTVAWSTAGLFTRLIPLDAWTILAWRGFFGFLGMALFMAFTEGGRAALGSVRRLGWPGWSFAVISAIGMLFYITSFRHTTVAHNAVIYATIPFLAAGLSFLVMRERPTRSAMLASTAALLGVATMVGLGTEGGLYGDFLSFCMTLCVTVMMVIVRRWPDIPAMTASCMSALLCALVCWPFGEPLAVSGHDLMTLAAFGLINSAMGLGLFTLGARYLPATETALIGALDAPLAPLWVWALFGETPSGPTIAGGGVVFVAVMAHIAASTRRVAAVAQPG